jgi:hypothetical protein
LYIKNEISAQKENEPKNSRIEPVSKRVIQPMVTVGDQRVCPECQTMGRVVWVSQDKKTMGIQCRRSHHDMKNPVTKYGATIVPSAKTRKNCVFLTPAA